MFCGNAISPHDNSQCDCYHGGKWHCCKTFLNQFHDAFIKQLGLVFNNLLRREVGVSLGIWYLAKLAMVMGKRHSVVIWDGIWCKMLQKSHHFCAKVVVSFNIWTPCVTFWLCVEGGVENVPAKNYVMGATWISTIFQWHYFAHQYWMNYCNFKSWGKKVQICI